MLAWAGGQIAGGEAAVTLAELEALISTGESEQLEFKRSTSQLRSGCDTLCAFLNGQGARCCSE